MANGQMGRVVQEGILAKEAAADWKQKMDTLRSQLKSQTEQSKIEMDRELQRRASKAAYEDALSKETEAQQQKQKAQAGSTEPKTANLPNPQLNQNNPAASLGQGGPSDLLKSTADMELPGVPGAPPFLVNQQRTTEVGPHKFNPVVTAPARTTRQTTQVNQNAMSAAQRQQSLLANAKARIQQQQFEQEQGRQGREFESQEARLQQIADNTTFDTKSKIARRGIQNRIELAEAGRKSFDAFADGLARVGADPLTEDDEALYKSGLEGLNPAERADVEKRTAAFRSEYDRKAAGTGTVEFFDPNSETGTTKVSGKEFLRMKGGRPGVPNKGMRITTDGVTVETGVLTGMAATPAMKTTLQKAVSTSTNALARLEGIKASYDPYFLTYQGKTEYYMYSKKRKMNIPLKPEERQYVDRYRSFTSGTMRNLNLYIKEITGAQMSEAEASRLMAAVANLDLDSVSFESDMKDITQELTMQIARSHMLMSGGFGDESVKKVLDSAKSADEVWDRVSMSDTIRIMGKRETDVRKEIQAAHPEWDWEVVKGAARDRVNLDFGMSGE